jgi:penicillin-binding protein 1C
MSGGRRLRRLGLATFGAAFALLLAALLLDRLFPPPLERYQTSSTLVLDQRGEILRAFTTGDGTWRLKSTQAQVDARFLALLRAYEDRRFLSHWGVDPLALARASWQWAAHGHVVSGGSTLTMQTARLLAPHPHTLGWKLVEMLRAVQLEAHFSKSEILSIYLTLAPYGGNLEGARAASLAYFGKEPRHLTLAEAALLVALPQSPERNRPDLHADAARHARDKVLARLAVAGAISAKDATEGESEPVATRRAALPFTAPHLADALAATAPSGSAIRTTLDGRLQTRAEAMVRREPLEEGASVALLIVDNATRHILAYVGSADYFGAAGQNDLTRAKRSPGSTLKPFIYGMGFDALLIHPDTIIDDAPLRFGDYAPQNFDRSFRGQVTVRQALQMSLNLPAVALLNRVGPQRFVSALRATGAELEFDAALGAPSLAVALGGVGISLHDLVMLYCGLSDGGEVRPLGMLLDEPAAKGTPLLTPAAAWYVTDILRGAALPEPFAQLPATGGRRAIAFKTGTSYGFRDAWAVGTSNRYTIGVWTGRPDGAPRPGHYGIATAAPLLFKLFGLLPAEDDPRPVPADVMRPTRAAALPVALRRFSVTGKPEALEDGSPLRILFPPPDAVLELGHDGGRLAPIALKALGGTPPLRWVVNGTPVSDAATDGDAQFWTPDGPGFATLAVIDAAGVKVSAAVRLVPAD